MIHRNESSSLTNVGPDKPYSNQGQGFNRMTIEKLIPSVIAAVLSHN